MDAMKALFERLNAISPGKWYGKGRFMDLLSLYRDFVSNPGFVPEFVDGVASFLFVSKIDANGYTIHRVTVEEWMECKKYAGVWAPSK